MSVKFYGDKSQKKKKNVNDLCFGTHPNGIKQNPSRSLVISYWKKNMKKKILIMYSGGSVFN